MLKILLATYNGEQYIAQQLDSLLKQTVKEYRVVVCDDCSTDNTWHILSDYQQRYPDKFEIKKNASNSKSAKNNFMGMLLNEDAQYVMLCDQDDIWKPEKIAKSLSAIKRIELCHGEEIPVLVHSDLEVVNENLNVISSSFMQYMNLSEEASSLPQLLAQNMVTGCTVIINRALLNILKAPMDYVIMHDWYMALCASAFGVIEYIDEPLICYRQHQTNAVAAKDVRSFRYLFGKISNLKEIKHSLDVTYRQAAAFYKAHYKRLSPRQKGLVKAYSEIPKLGKLGRIKTVVKTGALKKGTLRRLATFLMI